MNIESLAKEMGITLINNNIDTNNDPLYNDCMGTDDTIWVGEYDNKEFELISFFHEIGHNLVSQDFIKKWEYNTLIIELECWNLGIEKARQKGILFSDKAIAWGYKKALSYVGNDERENTAWDGSKLWINQYDIIGRSILKI